MKIPIGITEVPVAEKLGDFFVWLSDRLGEVTVDGAIIVLGVLAGLLCLWRLSLLLGPFKLCWYCGGKGYKRSFLGGVRTCDYCKSKGIRPRAGTGR